MTLTGCAFIHFGHRSAENVVVSATGRIGPLHVDESDRADAISFLGRPDAESHGRYFTRFDALGYGCPGEKATDKWGTPKCKTIYYFDSRTGKLALLYTEDARYVEPHGVHVGTRTPAAERRLHSRAFNGCYSGFRIETKHAFLVLWLYGGKGPSVGDYVGFLVVHSQRLNPGVLDCIDS